MKFHKPVFGADHRGFTLIELLVVISLITLLISLLLPALGKSRYRATLTKCASNLRQIAVGATSYATDQGDLFPQRMSNLTGGAKPGNIYIGGGGGIYDDRPMLSKYIPINATLNDPLTGEVNMENLKPATSIEAPYHLWFGYRYTGQKGLMKITDRLQWQGKSFDIIASDRDVVNWGGGTWVHGSHPDHAGVMYDEVLQMQSDSHFSGGNYIFSRWQSHTTFRRGLIDLNFARVDCSVFMLGQLEVQDPRLTPVPEFANGGNWPIAPTYLPTP